MIDLVILLIIVLFTFIGYKQGLIKAVVKILSFFIAIILAFSLCTPIANTIMEKTTIDENIGNAIIEKLLSEQETNNQNIKIDSNLVSILKIDTEGTIKNVAQEFSAKIIKLASLIVTFIIVKVLLLVLLLFTDLIAKIPVIKQFNKLGGTIYGFAKGMLLICTIFAIIFVLSPMIDLSFINKINDSILGKIIYNNNILINWIIG